MPDAQEQTSLGDAIGAAWDAAESAGAEDATPVVEAPEAAPAEQEAPATAEDRREVRFTAKAKAPKPKEEPPQGLAPKETAPVAQPVATPELIKPPASLKPAAREEWAKVPRAVQEDIRRVDAEVQKTLQVTAGARKTAESLDAALKPYRHLIQGDPIPVIGNLVQTAAKLQTGTPAERAATVGEIIRGYGVDVEALAAYLEGKPAPAQAQQRQEQFRDPRLDKLLTQHEERQRAQAEENRTAASQQLEDWKDGKEFFDDVRDDMADAMAAARRRGKEISLDEAYERACLLNPDVRPLWEQRKATQAASAPKAPTRPTRVASTSLRHEPSLPTDAKANSLRGTLEEQWDALTK